MAYVPHREITEARLKGWAEKLALHTATPILLVGVGHERNSGDLVICVPDEPEITTALLLAILRKALVELERPKG